MTLLEYNIHHQKHLKFKKKQLTLHWQYGGATKNNRRHIASQLQFRQTEHRIPPHRQCFNVGSNFTDMKITYYDDGLTEFFDDLKETVRQQLPDIELDKVKRGPQASGHELNEVIIYVTENKIALLVSLASGVIGSALWDMIKLAWSKIAGRAFQYLQGGEIKNRKGNISLVLQVNKEREIEFKLSGQVEQEMIPEIMEKLKDFVRNDQPGILENEKDFALDRQDKKRYRVKYDEVNKVWTAIQLNETERRFREIRRAHQ